MAGQGCDCFDTDILLAEASSNLKPFYLNLLPTSLQFLLPHILWPHKHDAQRLCLHLKKGINVLGKRKYLNTRLLFWKQHSTTSGIWLCKKTHWFYAQIVWFSVNKVNMLRSVLYRSILFAVTGTYKLMKTYLGILLLKYLLNIQYLIDCLFLCLFSFTLLLPMHQQIFCSLYRTHTIKRNCVLDNLFMHCPWEFAYTLPESIVIKGS